ncbi:MAG: hypothetical protein PHE79_11700 [Eubacteriales bacterium]|nr:hypothetical protein [Eubacteriales bacterium]
MSKKLEPNTRIETTAILELLRMARIMKRQLKILKGMQLNQDEKTLIKKAIESVEDDCNLFKIN